jgi:AmmeMemoRadiSam system protein B
MTKLRHPAVAGSFYPDSPDALLCDIKRLINDANDRAPEAEAAAKALIVPHAGYRYSGPIAASAYRQLAARSKRIRRVVLLGPSHHVGLRGLGAPSADAFRTPLGDIPIDRDAIDLVRDLPQVAIHDAAHAQEHSLEVQLPFLQYLLEDFSLVPFSVGDAEPEEVAEVLERLWGGDETLILVSSDLSHYLDDATARAVDAETTRAIESLDVAALDYDSACGRNPVRGLLAVAQRRGLAVRTLDVRNSGDIAGGRDQVVGYGAYAFEAGQTK